MARRRFGSIITKHDKNGNTYLEARYRLPVELQNDYPNQPERITKRFDTSMELEAQEWLYSEEKLIRLGTWTPLKTRKAKIRSTDLMFHDYAADWIENRRRADGTPIQETTKQKYREYLANHLDPVFGQKRLTAISYQNILKWYDSFPVGKKGLGASVRRNSYSLLKAVLDTAAATPIDDTGLTLIERNPAKLRVGLPRNRHDYPIAELEELKTLRLSMPKGLELAIPLAGVLGLREGEVCGLQRQDIDLDKRILHVRHAVKSIYDRNDHHRILLLDRPKSASSVRDLRIPDFMVSMLEGHLELYVEDTADSMIFTGERSGTMLAPQTLRNV